LREYWIPFTSWKNSISNTNTWIPVAKVGADACVRLTVAAVPFAGRLTVLLKKLGYELKSVA